MLKKKKNYSIFFGYEFNVKVHDSSALGYCFQVGDNVHGERYIII
jgi:hypothetical protein